MPQAHGKAVTPTPVTEAQSEPTKAVEPAITTTTVEDVDVNSKTTQVIPMETPTVGMGNKDSDVETK